MDYYVEGGKHMYLILPPRPSYKFLSCSKASEMTHTSRTTNHGVLIGLYSLELHL